MGDSTKDRVSRRQFIRKTTAGAVAAGTVLRSGLGPQAAAAAPVPAPARVLGANDRLSFGVIGTKGMGGGHLQNLLGPLRADNVQVIGVCDVWEKARSRARQGASLPDAQVYADYRRLLEDRDIDAVVVATPDHWHAAMAIHAMQAGKHVYIEKPMTRTMDEGFRVYDVAKRTGRLVQVGSQGCSDPKYIRTRQLFRTGDLGRLLWAQGSYCRNNPQGEWNYELDPDANEQTVDWRMWLGRARRRSWSAERYFRWRKFWDYGNGIIGDLWPHRLHPLMYGMNLLEYPSSVSCMGGNLCDTDRGTDGTVYGERREVADTTVMTVQFPSGAMIVLAGATTNERGLEDVIRTQKANVTLGGGRLQIHPERPFSDEIDARDETPPDSGESHEKHMRNFIVSIRNNEPPTCDVELGVRVQAIVSMAEESYRKNRTVRFDERRRRMLI